MGLQDSSLTLTITSDQIIKAMAEDEDESLEI